MVLKRISQLIVTLPPNFLSWTVIAMFSTSLLATENGMLNKALGAFGIGPLSFFSEAGYWHHPRDDQDLAGSRFGSIIYMATISGINPDIYESASIDGAGRWKKIMFITLPLLKPTSS